MRAKTIYVHVTNKKKKASQHFYNILVIVFQATTWNLSMPLDGIQKVNETRKTKEKKKKKRDIINPPGLFVKSYLKDKNKTKNYEELSPFEVEERQTPVSTLSASASSHG